MTVAQAVQTLRRAGIPSPDHDARVLANHDNFDELIARRAAREPLQYIVGTAPFRHLEILVGPGAFIPRPETELLAGWVIDAISGLEEPTVVDLCTGPGTIALAIAQEVPHASVFAVDVDREAVDWAHRNVAATGLRVTLQVADISDAFPDLDGMADVVVANPPYLERGSVEQPEVRDHEPHVSLYADDDGLSVIRMVTAAAHRLVRPGGLVAIEHGDAQGAVVPALLAADGFLDVQDHRDLTGRDRFATGRRP